MGYGNDVRVLGHAITKKKKNPQRRKSARVPFSLLLPPAGRDVGELGESFISNRANKGSTRGSWWNKKSEESILR